MIMPFVIEKEVLRLDTNDFDKLQKMLEKSVRKEIFKALESMRESDKITSDAERNYFKDTEMLLYSYPSLKISIAQVEEDLSNGELQIHAKSKDIVRYTGNTDFFREVDKDEFLQKRMVSMERTKSEVRRIEAALETIKNDRYFKIIPLRYWEQLEPEMIAETLYCDERTYRRHRNRLVNKLKIVLFGAEALPQTCCSL
jgi:hypothetical protein